MGSVTPLIEPGMNNMMSLHCKAAIIPPSPTIPEATFATRLLLKTIEGPVTAPVKKLGSAYCHKTYLSCHMPLKPKGIW
jgi:hypothetical protein